MAKKLKIGLHQAQTIREAFDDFLLQKKALGLADKTIEAYSHYFGNNKSQIRTENGFSFCYGIQKVTASIQHTRIALILLLIE